MVAGSTDAAPQKNRRDFRKERESEMTAIWGSEVRGEVRFPKRKGGANKNMTLAGTAAESPMDPNDLLSDNEHEDAASDNGENGTTLSHKDKKKLASKKALAKYRLHCFVESGTSVNDIREVFEQYEPKVDLRTSQKGNLLNKVHYAMLTFRNKPLALHAVQKLDGTNQRDLLGVTSLKLSMCLTREQNKLARKKARRQTLKEVKANKMKEVEDEETFIKNFMASNR
jgi:hypothetical protein